MSKQGKKLTKLEFTKRAIVALRDTEQSKGIHAVFTGFNAAYRKYFPDADVKHDMAQLEEQGHITVIPAKGGVRLYLADEAPTGGEGTLKKILA